MNPGSLAEFARKLELLNAGHDFLDPLHRIVVPAAGLSDHEIPNCPPGDFAILLETLPGRSFSVTLRHDEYSKAPVPMRLGVPLYIPWRKKLMISTATTATAGLTLLVLTGRGIGLQLLGSVDFPQSVELAPPTLVQDGNVTVSSTSAVAPNTSTLTAGGTQNEPVALHMFNRGPQRVFYGWGAVAGNMPLDPDEYRVVDRVPSTAISFIKETGAADPVVSLQWFSRTKSA